MLRLRLRPLFSACLALAALSFTLQGQTLGPSVAPMTTGGLSPATLATPPVLAPKIGEVSFGVRDDSGDGVAFPLMLVSQAGLTYGLTGDARGETDSLSLVLNDDIEVRLEESLTTTLDGAYNATTIGQQFTYHPMAPGESLDGLRLYYHQPTARRLSFDSSVLPHNDGESGWFAYPASLSPQYLFEAGVAELVTSEVISNYSAFKGGGHTDDWLHGLLIRVAQEVDLTSDPVGFAIERDGYVYADSGPVVQTVYTGSHPGGNGLSVSLVDVDDDTLWVTISGFLRPGDNLVLVANPDPAPASAAPGLPGPIIFPATTAGSCEPGAPSCDTDSCTPGISGGYNCGAPKCTPNYVLMDGVVCAPCGAEVSKEKCTEFKGGISAKWKFSWFGSGFELTPSGEIKGKICSTVTALKGNCAQGFFCYTRCQRTCTVDRMAKWGNEPVQYTYNLTGSCSVEGITSATSCEHTDC